MKTKHNLGNLSVITFGGAFLTNDVVATIEGDSLVISTKNKGDIIVINAKLSSNDTSKDFHINSEDGQYSITVETRSAEVFINSESGTVEYTFVIDKLRCPSKKADSEQPTTMLDEMISRGGLIIQLESESIAERFMQNGEMKEKLNDAVTSIVSISHALASKSGWWDLPQSVIDARETILEFNNDKIDLPSKVYRAVKAQADWKPNIAEKLCLIHSEVSEAMEGDRKNLFDDHLPDRLMLEVELADAVIRIADLAGYLKLDLGGAVVEKLAYNQQRADHKRENRDKEDGKKY